jgi:hypothetical protein
MLLSRGSVAIPLVPDSRTESPAGARWVTQVRPNFMTELTPQMLEILQNPDFRRGVTLGVRASLMKRAAARGDVLAWGAYAMPEKFSLPFCRDLHGWMVDNRRSKTSALKAPRGFAKTTIGSSLIPMYQALNEPKAYSFYLSVQANDVKALAVNRTIKAELEENDAIRAAYGNQISPRWTDAEFQLRNGVVFKSVGAGCSLRGLQYRNRRPDYVTLDDAYDENEIYSEEATERVNDWIRGTLYKVLARSRDNAFHVTGTSINKRDILELMSKWPGCTYATFGAIKADGSPLWPELYTLADLAEDRERMGTALFNREMLNILTDDSESIVKGAWLKNWEFDPAVVFARNDRDFHIVEVVLACDPSTGTEEGDPAGFATVVKTKGPGTRNDFWLMDAENKIMSWDERMAQLERMQSTINARGPVFRLRRAKVEAIGGFKDFANQVKAHTSLPVELVLTSKGKVGSLAAKAGVFEFGKFHVSKEIPQKLRDELHSQLTQNEPKHEDLRDAVLMAIDDQVRDMRSWV